MSKNLFELKAFVMLIMVVMTFVVAAFIISEANKDDKTSEEPINKEK